MSRKGIFANLSPEEDRQALQADFDDRPLLSGNRTKAMSAVSGAVEDLKERSRRADEIEKKLSQGYAVIDMDTASIEPSFVQDRMGGDIDGLLASIREQGQQVPILVRPHPEQAGRYQVAFGHRRLRVMKELGLAVKAIVRDLSDEQLVIAQGQENNERQDLTFIEKARFANRLSNQFSRDIVIAALSIHKSDVSRMLSVVSSIPADTIEAIGSAPGIGMKSWVALAEILDKGDNMQRASTFLGSAEAKEMVSGDRFRALVSHLTPRAVKRGVPDLMTTSSGERLAQVIKSRSVVDIRIDRKDAPDFAAFVLEKLPALFEEHRSRGSATDQRKSGE